MTADEVRHMVGDRIFEAYWPTASTTTTPRTKAMKVVGTTDHGEVVELNRRAVESDLVIYVNLNFVPMDGGHKSVAVGLCGYKASARTTTRRRCATATGTWIRDERARDQRRADGPLVEKMLNVFTSRRRSTTGCSTARSSSWRRTRTTRRSRVAGSRPSRSRRRKLPQAARQAIF